MEKSINALIRKLCEELHIGTLIELPISIDGGLLHQLYKVNTTIGSYAIKRLNPQIMKRPTALSNFIYAEKIAMTLSNALPVIAAKHVNGKQIQQFAGNFFLVFDWLEGQCIKGNSITLIHCSEIGKLLAHLHRIDQSIYSVKPSDVDTYIPHDIDWDFFLAKASHTGSRWINEIMNYQKKLYEWTEQSNDALKQLFSDRVISHLDLEPKNVLWQGDKPYIIDWESAGHINAKQDLLETAMYWSITEEGMYDKAKFMTFIRSYQRINNIEKSDWTTVLASGYLGKLGWLEYSMKRALWIECVDEAEQRLGEEQILQTLNALVSYEKSIAQLIEWLNEIV